MAGSTNFLQFDPPATNALNDAAYTASSLRAGGFPLNALVPSNLINKTLYQVSTFVAAFGQMMANKGFVVSDANLATLVAVLANVITTADAAVSGQTVPFSPTPVFNAALGAIMDMTLQGSVTASSITGQVPFSVLTFIIHQDGVGGRTLAWPTNFISPPNVSTNPLATSVVKFVVDATGNIRPYATMVVS
jgi:hypothetical protein